MVVTNQIYRFLNSDRIVLLRRWAVQGGVAVFDQVVFSGANFVSSILLARWLLPKAYGAYAISFSVLMLFYQLHFSFFLEPMGVIGITYYRKSLVAYLKGQVVLHFLISMPFGILLALISYFLMSGGPSSQVGTNSSRYFCYGGNASISFIALVASKGFLRSWETVGSHGGQFNLLFQPCCFIIFMF